MEASKIINQSITNLFNVSGFVVEHPGRESWGDWATNAALVMAKKGDRDPMEVAAQMVVELEGDKSLKNVVEKITVAEPGFINFTLKGEYLIREVKTILAEKDDYGRSIRWNDQKVIVEFTDPNPFKQFHIGHLMSNAIGESLSRLIEFSGAEVKRACYQGDVGMHVAKSIWGIKELLKEKNQTIEGIGKMSLENRVEFLGTAYAMGATAFEDDEALREAINDLNKIVYERSEPEINGIYDLGKEWSLAYFETIYKKLGTKFDLYLFESEAGPAGLELVKAHIEDGVFEESQGAVVFKGEKYGLHTRVFINSVGLPTYEAKELGLAKTKHDLYPYDKSIIVTGNEINAYFKVLLKALSLIFPDLSIKTEHIGHGMLNLKNGKMSSRTGNVVTGESLLLDVAEAIQKKMEETDKIKEIKNADEVINAVSVGAIKFSMLKQSPGKDIAFDFQTSLSFEGDSGPYVQYAYARAMSVLDKVGRRSDEMGEINLTDEEKALLRWLGRFAEMVDLSVKEMAPNFICSYLVELSSRFNHFYANCQIVGDEKESDRLAMTEAVAIVIKRGLWLLGIETVEKM